MVAQGQPSDLAMVRRATAGDLARTALGFAAVAAALLWGLCVLIATRSRRRAINAMTSFFADVGSRAVGLRLEIEGAEHLVRHRPCVFIYNHQSTADILLLCMVLRGDATAVAKRELRRNPLLGPAFWLAGIVFIDRFDRERAIEALQPAIATLHSGISIAMAPEGTRSRDESPGPFKKGPFRLAMAAQVPVVPIVFVNARDVMPPRKLIARRATVRAIVRAPIPAHEWRREDLDERIAELREHYCETIEAEWRARRTGVRG